MSDQREEIIRRMYAAWNRRDFDGGVQFLHPEVEVHPALEPVEQVGASSRDLLRGRDEVRQFLEDLGDTLGTVTVEFEEMIEGEGGRVIAVENWHVVGRQEIEIDTKLTDVYAFRDDLIVRVDGFRDKDAALEAFGLPP
jgi:ketosteroid isomerase-like protein